MTRQQAQLPLSTSATPVPGFLHDQSHVNLGLLFDWLLGNSELHVQMLELSCLGIRTLHHSGIQLMVCYLNSVSGIQFMLQWTLCWAAVHTMLCPAVRCSLLILNWQNPLQQATEEDRKRMRGGGFWSLNTEDTTGESLLAPLTRP